MTKRVMCRDGENRLYCVGSFLNEEKALDIASRAKDIFRKTWIEGEGLFTASEPKEDSDENDYSQWNSI